MTGTIAVPTAKSGRWRPMQGAAHLIALFIGLRGFIGGPIPNEPLLIVTNNNVTLCYIWYASLVVGSLTAIVGELIQLRVPFITTTTDQITDFVAGLITERAGTLLLSAIFLGYSLAILFAPDVNHARSITYIIIGLGFLGRTCQISLDRKRLKSDLQEATVNANNI